VLDVHDDPRPVWVVFAQRVAELGHEHMFALASSESSPSQSSVCIDAALGNLHPGPAHCASATPTEDPPVDGARPFQNRVLEPSTRSPRARSRWPAGDSIRRITSHP
jgi:hypothetical protein